MKEIGSYSSIKKAEPTIPPPPAKSVPTTAPASAIPKEAQVGSSSTLLASNAAVKNIRANLQSFDGTTAPSVFSSEATVTRTGGQVIIDSGAGDDQIGVMQDSTTGDITVNVNGESQTFTGRDRDNLVIRAGNGNDTIWVDENVKVNLRLEGQDGDDFIRAGGGNDKIEGGAGNDRLHGAGGADYINGSTGEDIIYGDDGDDVVYGGDDNDQIFGNAGNDYLEGSKGDDEIYGNDGNDIISGGLGSDYLRGAYGNDAIYAGQGKDDIYGDDGTNQIYSQTDDTVQTNGDGVNNNVVPVDLTGTPGTTGVIVNGSDEFRERVEADLEMLRSSPAGRQMLEGFDQANRDDGVTVTINGFTENNATADWANRLNPSAPQPFLDPVTGARGTPNSSTINYNPSLTPAFENANGSITVEVPSTILFHEMAHAWDFTHGTFRNNTYTGTDPLDSGRFRNGERVAVGVPIDHDGDPTTPEQRDDAIHPYALTENGLRTEMGMDTRNQYHIVRMVRV